MDNQLSFGLASMIIGWTIFYSLTNATLMLLIDKGDLMYFAKRALVNSSKGREGMKRYLRILGICGISAAICFMTGLKETTTAWGIYVAVYSIFFYWTRNTAVQYD